MNTTGLKVVIDTNIFIAIIGRESPNRWIFDKLISGELTLFVSNQILLEYEEILIKKTTSSIAKNIIDFLLISPHVIKIEPFYNWALISDDPDDNKFIDCFIVSDSDCLISNDRHFNRIRQIDFPKIKVLTLEEFKQDFKR